MSEHTTEARPGSRTRPSGMPGGTTAPAPAEEAGARAGWVRFGAIVMLVVGLFGVIEGLAAILTPTYFVTATGTVLVLS